MGYEGLQFVPGVKKQLQYSLRGIEETLHLSSVEVDPFLFFMGFIYIYIYI
jgi:hypothetical protein